MCWCYVLSWLLSDADHNNIPHAGDHVLTRTSRAPGQDRPVTACAGELSRKLRVATVSSVRDQAQRREDRDKYRADFCITAGLLESPWESWDIAQKLSETS